MLVKFVNFLNGRPELKMELTHLYKLRKRYNCYNKNSHISPIYLHVPLKNLGLTFALNKKFWVRNYSILASTAGSKGFSSADSCDR